MSQEIELKKFQEKKWKKIGVVAGAVVLFLILILASLRIRTINFEGNDHVTNETLEAEIFDSSFSYNPLVFAIKEKVTKHKEIPFVDKYSVSMDGISSVHIIVYEKNIIGYFSRMENDFYFDKDGVVVESIQEERKDIPLIEGLQTEKLVLGEQIPMEKPEVFQEILNISQFLRETEIQWGTKTKTLVELLEKVSFDESNNVTCDFGKIKVYLGSRVDMEEKLLEMSNILPNLRGKEGTLYLNSYDPVAPNPSYVFK